MRPVAQARNEAVFLDAFPSYTFHMIHQQILWAQCLQSLPLWPPPRPPPQPSGTGTATCHRDHCRGLPGRPTPRAANSGRTAARFYLFMLSRITSLICSKSSEASLPSQSVRPKVLQRAINVLYDLWWLLRPLADRPLELQMRASACLHLRLP